MTTINRIKKIQSYESGCEVKENYFSTTEHANLVSLMLESYSDESTLHYRNKKAFAEKADIMSIPQGENKRKIFDLLYNRLKNEISAPFDLEFTFHKNFNPYSLHTDTGYDDDIFLKQGIIPIEINSPDAEVYTVIMDQKCYSSRGFHPDTINNNANELDKVFNYHPNVPMNEEMFNLYWSDNEFKRSTMTGFSIHTPFKWKLRDMAIWDRSLIHCSSDFNKPNINYKVGLMWISTLVKD